VSGKVIAVANMKGGVGKTATTVSLAEALAVDSGARVLVVDLDAQMSASFALCGNKLLDSLIRQGETVTAYLEDAVVHQQQVRLGDYIHDGVGQVTVHGHTLPLSIIAASTDLRLTEREIIFKLTERRFSMRAIEGQVWKLMADELESIKQRYDYIIFDCSPGISAMTEVAIRLADLVIVPTIPDYISALGFATFFNGLWTSKSSRQSGLPMPRSEPHLLATRVLTNARQHRDILAAWRKGAKKKNAGFKFMKVVVPQNAAVPRALEPLDESPTFRVKWGPTMVEVLGELVAEIKGALDAA